MTEAMSKPTQALVNKLKREAKKKHKADPSIKHVAALDALAREHGYVGWKELIAAANLHMNMQE